MLGLFFDRLNSSCGKPSLLIRDIYRNFVFPIHAPYTLESRDQSNRSDAATVIVVPIKIYTGQAVDAVDVSAPDTLVMEGSVRDSYTTLLIKTANKISFELGGLS